MTIRSTFCLGTRGFSPPGAAVFTVNAEDMLALAKAVNAAAVLAEEGGSEAQVRQAATAANRALLAARCSQGTNPLDALKAFAESIRAYAPPP
ncbi:hypothetical protein HLB44_25490 [Aquincola sp. S2]|uniref:DUF982 domain-containing protein n=1 Tax=Pseudaquabacterium terrae TaxID=2732868 RepID=A0ABX2EP22_9BURK|nr:hypothetical protein [Aquabacterium terrae]NRF70368.1 hypothetical protein [Aquabacterium terrae]